MRNATLPIAFFALLALASFSLSEQKDKIKKDEMPNDVDATYLEKLASLKLKSALKGTIRNPAKRAFMTMNVVMEFTADLQPKDLTELKQLLNASPRKLRFVPLDADGVAIPPPPGLSDGAANWLIEGELTGSKGDAFRFKVIFDSDTTPKIRRVAIRPVDAAEEKKK